MNTRPCPPRLCRISVSGRYTFARTSFSMHLNLTVRCFTHGVTHLVASGPQLRPGANLPLKGLQNWLTTCADQLIVNRLLAVMEFGLGGEICGAHCFTPRRTSPPPRSAPRTRPLRPQKADIRNWILRVSMPAATTRCLSTATPACKQILSFQSVPFISKNFRSPHEERGSAEAQQRQVRSSDDGGLIFELENSHL